MEELAVARFEVPRLKDAHELGELLRPDWERHAQRAAQLGPCAVFEGFRWIGGIEVIPIPAAGVQTASGTVNAPSNSNYGPGKNIRAQLNVTAVTGTNPTLDVTIEDTLDATNWNTIGTFTQKVAAGVQVINITTPFSDTLRVKWVIGGTATPTFTFGVTWAVEGPLSS